MNEIEYAIFNAKFPKLDIKIKQFKHKQTGEIRFCVMEINSTFYIFDGSEWELQDDFILEGTERIREHIIRELKK